VESARFAIKLYRLIAQIPQNKFADRAKGMKQ
jgi:hypothetical protein